MGVYLSADELPLVLEIFDGTASQIAEMAYDWVSNDKTFNFELDNVSFVVRFGNVRCVRTSLDPLACDPTGQKPVFPLPNGTFTPQPRS